MSIYKDIALRLEEKVNAGELTLEQANKLNDLAYEKYAIYVEKPINEVKKEETYGQHGKQEDMG